MFNAIKITESIGITVFTWLAGYIRYATDGYTGVSIMLCFCACVSILANYLLIEETRAFGYQRLNLSTLLEMVNSARAFITEKSKAWNI